MEGLSQDGETEKAQEEGQQEEPMSDCRPVSKEEGEEEEEEREESGE